MIGKPCDMNAKKKLALTKTSDAMILHTKKNFGVVTKNIPTV